MGNGGNPNQMLELTRKINEARSLAVDNEKRIIELEKALAEKNEWYQTIRDLIGKKVTIRMVNGDDVLGFLRSVDRYTMLVDVVGETTPVIDTQFRGIPVIVHKGAIATIRPV